MVIFSFLKVFYAGIFIYKTSLSINWLFFVLIIYFIKTFLGYYCKSGLIKPDFFTPGGHRRFSLLHIRQVFSLHNYSSKIVAYSRVSKPMVLNYLPFLSKKRFVCARVKINSFCSIFILF